MFSAFAVILRGMEGSAARLLVIEDDDALRVDICACFSGAGYLVASRADGRDEFDNLVTDFQPDVAVLDVMLPGASGLTLARRLRQLGETAVLFLTARDEVVDRLAGFDAGADDYLVKPFVMAELLARTRAVLRRSGRGPDSRLEVGDLVLDENTCEVTRGRTVISLTATELRVLAYLVRGHGRVLSKTQILTQVWGYDAYDANLVEAYVSTLRRKLEVAGPRLIHTVRGVGYRVKAPAR